MPLFASRSILCLGLSVAAPGVRHGLTAAAAAAAAAATTVKQPCRPALSLLSTWVLPPHHLWRRNASTRSVPPQPPPNIQRLPPRLVRPPLPPPLTPRPRPRRRPQPDEHDDEFNDDDDGGGGQGTGLRAGRYKRSIGPMVWASCLFGFSLALYASYYYSTYTQALKVAEHLDLAQNADVSDRWHDRTRDFDDEVDVSEKFLLLKAKRRRLVQTATGKVLEVSCGTGRNMELYDLRPYDALERQKEGQAYGRSRRTQITSITFNDQSEVMIERAEAKFDAMEAARPEALRFNGRVNFVVGDAGIKGVIPRPPGGYDTIVQTMGVCSMVDAPAFLRRLGDLCRQPGERRHHPAGGLGPHSKQREEEGEDADDARGGKILLLEHGRSYYSWLNRLLDNGAKMHANHYGCWWNKDVAEVVRQSGLVVDRVRRYNFGTTYEYVLRPAPAPAQTQAQAQAQQNQTQSGLGK